MTRLTPESDPRLSYGGREAFEPIPAQIEALRDRFGDGLFGELLGERLADKTQVAAQLVDAAMRPTQALALWSVQARPAQHSPYP